MLKTTFFVLSISLLFVSAVSAQSSATPTASTALASTPAKRPPVFRPTKDQIMQVQTLLKETKLYDGEADGKYNDPTRTGIKNFQKNNGLKETGTLNRATLEKFGVELTDNQKKIPVSPSSFAAPAASSGAASTENKPKKAAPFRASKDQIKAAQKMLKEKTLYGGEETGNLDYPTREGLKKFQEANGVKVTGTLNAVTLEAMGIPLTDKQKAVSDAATPKN